MMSLNWQQLSQSFVTWIQQDPLMFTATLGLVFSGGYLLLMIVTRLGDVKPGAQALVLSAVLHTLLTLFWGSLVIQARRNAPPPAPEGEIPVRQIVLEDDAGPQPNFDPDSGAVWDRPPGMLPQERTRMQEREAEPVPLEIAQNQPDMADDAPSPFTPPRFDLTPSTVPDQSPAAVRGAPDRPAAPADNEEVIEAPTAQARPDARTTDPGRMRTTGERPTLEPDEPSVARPRPTPETGVQVDPSLSPAAGSPLSDDVAVIARTPGTGSPLPRTGPAPEEMPLEDDLSGPEGVSPATASNGSRGGGRFSRMGRNPAAARAPGGTGSISRPSPGPLASAPLLSTSPTRPGTPGFEDNPATPRPAPAIGMEGNPRREGAPLPGPYQLRNLRRGSVPEGATEKSEEAVERALAWLAAHQSPDGHWDADGFDALCPGNDRCEGPAGLPGPVMEKGPDRQKEGQQAGQEADSGLTALVLLCFLGADYTHERGQYADEVDRGIRWLIRNQEEDGFLGGKAGHFDRMYCHGMATYALAEAYGMTSDLSSDLALRDAVVKGTQYIIRNQNPKDGGWRYAPGQMGDMSMFGWQLMALKSAEIAGIDIPRDTRRRMVAFLNDRSLGERNGLAGYRIGEKPKPSMTAEALFSKQILGLKRDHPSSVEAVAYLREHPPRLAEMDMYYWYYGTLAMFHHGGDPWLEWNGQLRDTIIEDQQLSGHAAGSWDPRDPWGRYGGRLYSTALCTLCLEVYYRFLPLYREGDAGGRGFSPGDGLTP